MRTTGAFADDTRFGFADFRGVLELGAFDGDVRCEGNAAGGFGGAALAPLRAEGFFRDGLTPLPGEAKRGERGASKASCNDVCDCFSQTIPGCP